MLFLFLLLQAELFPQARLIINNGGYLVMSGGTSGAPIYLVIENSAINGITRVTSGHIISEGEYNRVQWNARTTIGTFTFPIGRSTTDYIPFVFDKTTAGTESGIGTVRVASWFTAANAVWPSTTSLCGIATENDVIDRCWVIDVLNYSANPTATVRFSYKDPGDLDAIPEADLRAQRWNSALAPACKWENPSLGTVNTVSDYVEVAGTSVFSPWTLTRVSAPLPIALLNFDAVCEKNKIILNWTTGSETNNDYFTIERAAAVPTVLWGNSSSGQWEEIEKIKGAGNSSTIRNYEFVDTELPLLPHSTMGTAAFYYRLRQTDIDGKNIVYPAIAVDCKREKLTAIEKLYLRNNEEITLEITAGEEKEFNLMIYDRIGKQIINESVFLKKGHNQVMLKSTYHATGIYLVRLFNESSAISQKFLIR